ncbi:MAG TPA: T9SS type A sorting domain-containing protein [Ignavibacteriaceae bacterium]|nr:T9SS type A sorting domain-containing protein [Ignavibacteriaceae bacterium]
MSQLNIEIPSDSIIPTYSFGNNTFSTLGTSVAVLNAGLIPVELTSFSASVRSGNEVYLEWVTSTETNNSGFAVERRIDAGWSEIGFVKGNGTTTKIHQYHLVDKLMHKNNNYVIKYRLKQIDYNGEFRYSDEIEIKISNTVTGYSLSNNYPNPFNPSTRISYAIPIVSFVTLKIYDVIGNEVATLVNENKEAGLYELTFEAGKLSNGVYFYELKANEFRMVKKLVLMK